MRWGGGDILIGCLFSCNCRSQSFQGVVLILAQGRHVGCWSLSLACMFFFFHTLRCLHFPQEEESMAAIHVLAPSPLASLLSVSFFGGTHPKENSFVAKSFWLWSSHRLRAKLGVSQMHQGKVLGGRAGALVGIYFSLATSLRECLIPPVIEWR